MDIFSTCKLISNHFENDDEGQQIEGRKELLHLLDDLKKNEQQYTPLVNHLIRKSGLYPYMKPEHSDWSDQLVFEVFQSDVGDENPATLHREQSGILKKLLKGENIAVSAPTSFGKNFIIDAFISLKNPNNVMIIVPTIALTDETRRRINKKFSTKYKIITQADIEPSEKNIFIFTSERANSYSASIKKIDILIIDEFYKASPKFDKDRAPSLSKAIKNFSKITNQKYFLAPNISSLKNKNFLKEIPEFIKLDFNTVSTSTEKLYLSIETKDKDKKEEEKKKILLDKLASKETKSLIYAGTYKEIDKLRDIFVNEYKIKNLEHLSNFSNWLKVNYGQDYRLSSLVERGVGVHNGRLHRSLSQIQVKLFEEEDGLNIFLATSSIIEGVNTSAENIFLWSNKSGNRNIDIFTYKNIIGRCGRMFKYFIGKIYLLEKPPPEKEESTDLSFGFDEKTMSHIDENPYEKELTDEQRKKIGIYKGEMYKLLGKDTYEKLIKELVSNNSSFISKTIKEIHKNKEKWKSIALLNSEDVNKWDGPLRSCLPIMGSAGIAYSQFIRFVQVLSANWNYDFPKLMERLKRFITIDEEKYFQLEREVTFKLSSVLKDVNTIYNVINKKDEIDISPFITKSSYAFLPKLVYQLEEYGLPRMITKKLHSSKIIDVNNDKKSINELLKELIDIGEEKIKKETKDLDPFDEYIINYFYEGII